MSVSVVIPTYNGTRFLDEALKSVVGQSLQPQEVIVVDDCSTDGTPALIESLAATLSLPLRLIALPRNSGGPSHPMNVGVAAARGDIIVLLDQDDCMAPERIQELGGLLTDHPQAMLAFGRHSILAEVDGVSQTIPHHVQNERFEGISHRPAGNNRLLLDGRALYVELIAEGNFLAGASNIAFRKAAWEEVGGFRESEQIVWDLAFYCQLTRLGPVGFTPRIVSCNRRHHGSLSADGFVTRRAALRLVAEHLRAPLWPLTAADQRRVQRGIAFEYFSMGYQKARGGKIANALSMYYQAITADPKFVLPCLWSACKTPAHWLRARLRRSSPTSIVSNRAPKGAVTPSR